MGPKLLSHRSRKSGTLYSLRLLPIGGYVSMVGEDEESDDVNALNNKPIWQRFVIIAAGAIMNLVLGILLMSIMVASYTNYFTNTISGFDNAQAITAESGLMVNDTITKVNGERVHIYYDLIYTVMREGTEPADVTVIRDGKKMVIEDVVFPTITEQGTKFGEVDFITYTEMKTPLTVVKHAYYQSVSSIKIIWQSLFDLVTGRYGVEQLSGPVGTTNAISEVAKEGLPNLTFMIVLITMNLGVFNLLPLPALDGGRLVFLIVELVRGKPIKPEYEGYVHFAGIVIMMLFMVFITYKDIVKLFVK